MDRIEIRAYAKINLTLDILDKLSNGYHKINSIFQAIDLYDTILISKAENGFYLDSSVDCSDEENLITKALEKIQDFVKKDLSCRIHLSKNIPESSGLGGGSSYLE